MQRRWKFVAVIITGVAAASLAFTSLAAGSAAATKVRVLMASGLNSNVTKATPNVVTAGSVTFAVTNVSNADTEVARFVVLKTNLAPGKLPIDKNGLVSETRRIGNALVLQPRKTGTVALNLKPGTYVVVDNMPWTYAHGQYAALQVTG
jgi:uncharacterized cupredoxin-like copper-binding protein